MPKRYAVQRPAVAQPLDKPYRFIPLTQNQIAIIDKEDFDRVSKVNWQARWVDSIRGFYAVRHKPGDHKTLIYMHHEVTGLRTQTDHRNHDTLDNRRLNLRPASTSQNCCNRGKKRANKSGYIGVHFHRASKKWIAYIGFKGEMKHLGCFRSPEAAARARDQAAKELHGEFAFLNFQTGGPVSLPPVVTPL